MVVNNSCYNCVHKEVCIHKSAYQAIAQRLEEMRLTKPFSVDLKCNSYALEIGLVRARE